MDSHENDRHPRSALSGGGGGGDGSGGVGVRRRPPTAPHAASSSYGTTNEGGEEGSPLLHHNEEGYPYPQSARRRPHYGRGHGYGYGAPPWYREPQKLILAATLAWVGGVMYLASLAHAVLRSHEESNRGSMGMGMMGSSMNDEVFQRWLQSNGGMTKTSGRSNNEKYGGTASDEHIQQWLESRSNKYGASSASGGERGEDFKEWLETQYHNKYGATADDGDFQQWLEAQAGSDQDLSQWMANKYGASQGGSAGEDKDFQQWMANKYGASGGGGEDEDFQQWLKSQNKYGASSSSSSSGSITTDSSLGPAWEDWVEYHESKKISNSYSSPGSTTNKGKGRDHKGGTTKKKDNKKKDNNVRFGSGYPYEEWLEYQENNKEVKYDADGMYGRSNPETDQAVAKSRAMGSSSEQQQEQSSPVAATSSLDSSSISTIDWPLQGVALPHSSCTASSGCSPSANVTVLVVYGPEYHSHISEMAWNVATGVHAAFVNHIGHHPSSPLHGHIVYGHTGNVTFMDILDADAVIIGSPVYNGNVHPDVQNWINYWHIDADLSNKFGGAFATAGGMHAGADGTIMSILRSMMVFQMMAVGGDSWTSPFGAVATMYEDPFGDSVRTNYFDKSCYFTADNGRQGDHLVHPYFLRRAYGLGERIANVTVAWKNSSYVRWS